MKYTDILSSVQDQLVKSTILPVPTTEVPASDNDEVFKKTPQEGLVNKDNNNIVVESQQEKIDQLKPQNPSDQAPIPGETQSQANDFTEVEEMEEESPEMELMEYKYDYYQMSLGSLKSIAQHAQAVVDAVERGDIKERLTESWLQGKIAVTEDYVLTIHNFLMFGESETDTEGAEAAKNLPGLWENIRRKKEREGKKYRPAKPGDKDRPDPEAWKKAQK